MTYTNCIDCPDHRVIPDPDPDDSFRKEDIAIVCLLKLNDNRDPESIFNSGRSNFKIVASECKPAHDRKESDTPDWCPLNS